jgi:hypothetical protein
MHSNVFFSSEKSPNLHFEKTLATITKEKEGVF